MGIVRINKTEEINVRLAKEGKIKTLNSAEDLKAIKELNSQMEQIRKDFRKKNFDSEQSARNTYIG